MRARGWTSGISQFELIEIAQCLLGKNEITQEVLEAVKALSQEHDEDELAEMVEIVSNNNNPDFRVKSADFRNFYAGKHFHLKRFTPLNEERIAKILSSCPEISDITRILSERAATLLETPKYRNLKNISDDENLIKNFQTIIEFLQECRLVGLQNEKGRLYIPKSHMMSAEGLAVINAFYKTKTANETAHEVVVVKNENLNTRNGSEKPFSIFEENKGIHNGLRGHLIRDLAGHTDKKFEKTYVVEIVGTTGCNHFISLTIRKEPGETEPLIELFDPSGLLVRRDFGAIENIIAAGRSPSLAVLATLQSVFKYEGISISQDKFFINSEPTQNSDNAYCGTFSIEQAYINARKSRVEHEAFLKKYYKFDSPCGGKTEVRSFKIKDGQITRELDLNAEGQLDMDIDEMAVESKEDAPMLALHSAIMSDSQFSSHYPAHSEHLKKIPHGRKDGSFESEDDRRERYMVRIPAGGGDDIGEVTIDINTRLEQSSIRHRLHLFEVIRSDAFLSQRSSRQKDYLPASATRFSEDISGFVPRSYVYWPENCENEKPQDPLARQIAEFIYPQTYGIDRFICPKGALEMQIILSIGATRAKAMIDEGYPMVQCKVEEFPFDFGDTRFHPEGVIINPEFLQRTKAIMIVPNSEEYFRRITSPSATVAHPSSVGLQTSSTRSSSITV